MGLLPGAKGRKQRAKLARAERKLIEVQTAQLRKEARAERKQADQLREEAAEGQPWYAQPTVSAMIRNARRDH